MKPKARIIINGAFGKMGCLATTMLKASNEFSVVAELGRDDELQEELIKLKPDLVLDLTRADAVFNNAKTFLKTQTAFVIGTSGLNHEQIQELGRQCQEQKLGGIVVPNFSIGSVLTTYFAKLAAPWFDGVEIIEMHHAQKADAPSGTALHTAKTILDSKKKWPHINSNPQPGRDFFEQQIAIHAVRMPGLLAVQQTIFGQAGETIELKHQIIDRQAYMPGLKLACCEALKLNELKIGLEHWLFQSPSPVEAK
jgi:4-hydroxy-tetrahydrodipicolinate reductase